MSPANKIIWVLTGATLVSGIPVVILQPDGVAGIVFKEDAIKARRDYDLHDKR